MGHRTRLTTLAGLVTTVVVAALVPAGAAQAAPAYGYTYYSNGSIDLTYACAKSKYYLHPQAAIVDNTQCRVRVWLHQNLDDTGWTVCISPRQFATPPKEHQHPANLLVTKVTEPCKKK